MRNIIQYPITLDEILETIAQLSLEASEYDEEHMVCGSMRPLVLDEAFRYIEKAKESGLTLD